MDREFEHRMTEVEERSKSNSHRLDEIEKRQDDLDELVGVVKVLADREVRVEDDVKEIKADVKSLATKPAKRWDKFLEIVLTVVIGAVLGFIFAKIGL